MSATAKFLSPSDVARQFGISVKALRLYEQRGLITPTRTAAGWRTYGPDAIRRVKEIVALRGLGFSLVQISRVQGGDTDGLEQALATHQTTLEHDLGHMSGVVACAPCGKTSPAETHPASPNW